MNGSATDLVVELAEDNNVSMQDGSDDTTYALADGSSARVEESAWAALPDLLVGGAGLWVGLCFYFPPNMEERLRAALRSWSSRRWAVVAAGTPDCAARYPHAFDDGAYLEIRWSNVDRGSQQLAQLDFSDINWLWRAHRDFPVGLVVHNIRSVAEEQGVSIDLE